MVTTSDVAYMQRAFFLAERGLGRTAPNPIVGAVVVSPDGTVVGQGAHLAAGGPHAEVVALDAAGAQAHGATLYCTLEPCSHTGRTPPCVDRIIGAGVVRVVIPMRDPNPQVSGAGVARLRAYGVEVTEGVCREIAAAQNAPFFTWISRERPFVTVKAALSRDGFVGLSDRRVRLTGSAADRYFHRQRAAVDAIAVGSSTVLADDPMLTARGAYRYRPLTRVLFDWRARMSPSARVFSTLDAGPVIMVVLAAAAETRPADLIYLERRGVIVERRKTRDLEPVLRWLAAREIVSLLVEGGPALHAAFHHLGVVDRVQWVVTPVRLGDGLPAYAGVLEDSVRRGAVQVKVLGDDLLFDIDVHGPR
jgi:diaminohydroxyphosphoribosylaminopyrimidine deaminase / 5-amino-6-(5-phosphoribosylamino)uracil reductase